MMLRLAMLFLMMWQVACHRTDFEHFASQHAGQPFRLLIQGGRIVDGTGKAAYPADLLIQQDTIAYIGKVDTSLIRVKRIIEAGGKVVTPGFIDTHAHGSPLETPAFQNFLAMGVTTIFLGQDGSAPENMAAWMQQVEDTVPGVNVAMFAGHNTLRMLSGIKYNPRPDRAQLEHLGQLLEQQMDAGCFGMSTGLEYVPGMYAPAYELEFLAEKVGKSGKLITSHIRNEDSDAVEKSIQELLALGRYCPVHVSHIKVVYGRGAQRAEEILQLLAEARRQGIQATADIYPYTASYTGISIVFPDWALPPHLYEQVVRNRRAELSAFLHNKIMQRNGPQATLLATPPYAGKTLARVAAELQKPFADVLIDDIQPGGASGAYFVMDDSLQDRLLLDSMVMVCSDGSPTGRHPRGHGTFARIMQKYVVEDSLLGLEEAVRKMTSLPAQTFYLPRRGRLQVGCQADVLVFDPQQVHASATYENPFQLARGFDYVLVNGEISVENGRFSGRRYGKLLKAF